MSTTISELFTRDPLALTNPEIVAMEAHLTTLQVTWNKEEEEAKAAGKASRSTKVKMEMGALLDVKLGDLS